MLQDFQRRTSPSTGAARLQDLRMAMAAAGVDGFLVPCADAHQGETVPPRDQRLAWLTGFSGSAGLAVITRDRAGIFVDGRYRLQVRDEVDLSQFTVLNHPDDKPGDWLLEVMPGGGRIGFDPWLHTAAEIETLTADLAPRQINLLRVENLVDKVWPNQPAAPARPIVVHPDALAGRNAGDKRCEIAKGLRNRELAAAILTMPDSIAWLLNIRGGDIARIPVPLVYAIVHADARVDLIADPAKIGEGMAEHFGPDVTPYAPASFGERLGKLEGRIAVDKATAPAWVSDRLAASGRAEVVWTQDPCVLPKACKTPAEIEGARAAHLRDGAAMVEFLAWLDTTAPAGLLGEIEVVRRLEEFRRSTGVLRDIAFETICGAGPNGAIVHYRVTENSNRQVSEGDVLLVDSGAQYADGTTDITRTIAIGTAPSDAVSPFTQVLKGLIAMSRLAWPEGLAGRDLDAVARVALWRAGRDYDHGTGHGVGAYLSVHEGPQALSRRATEVLRPGMIVSIEPGYYREGAFGIRIENLGVVQPPATPEGGERAMLSFETLTLAPIDRRLIAGDQLDAAERGWLDAYHARVASALGLLVSPAAARWLAVACAPL